MAEQFSIKMRGMRELRGYISGLINGGLDKADEAARKALAERMRDEVEQGYRSAAFGLSKGTKEAYAHGKLPGNQPARRPWSGKSMLRSGLLANSVICKKSGKAWRVCIDPNTRYGGDPADAARGVTPEYIASQLESPQPMIVQITKPMLNYLHLISGKKQAGAQTTASSGRISKIGDFIQVMPRARPIWGPVHQRAQRYFPAYMKVLHERLQKPATQGPR